MFNLCLALLPAFPVGEKQLFGHVTGGHLVKRENQWHSLFQNGIHDEHAPAVFAAANPVRDKAAVGRFLGQVQRLNGLLILVDGEEILV